MERFEEGKLEDLRVVRAVADTGRVVAGLERMTLCALPGVAGVRRGAIFGIALVVRDCAELLSTFAK